uniref:RNA helicase aquarius N-terminal domain-containing protein n=1 Tax=Timema bartmani TaxID=61472 RepID=A0A7R9F220_9NEOP|nr:unnamed protein product [Timema bartmani]
MKLVTQVLASRYWAPYTVGNHLPFDEKVVDDIYITEIYGSNFSIRRIMMLEFSQYLENYLWPNYVTGTSSHAHMMSIVVMINEKFRERVPAWQFNTTGALANYATEAGYCSDECKTALSLPLAPVGLCVKMDLPFKKLPEHFPGFFQQMLEACLLEGSLREQTALLVFLNHCFNSMEVELIRDQVKHLVSLAMWVSLQYAVDRAVLDVVDTAVLNVVDRAVLDVVDRVVLDAVDRAVLDMVDRLVLDVVDRAVLGMVDRVVLDMVDRAVLDVVDRAVQDVVDRAVLDVVDRVVLDAVDRAVLDAVDRVVLDVVDRVVLDAVDRAVLDMVGRAVLDMVDRAVLDVVDRAVLDVVDRVVLNAVDRVVLDVVDIAVLDAVDRAVLDMVDRAVQDMVDRVVLDVVDRAVLDVVDRAVLDAGRREQELRSVPKWRKYWKLIQKRDKPELKTKLEWERRFLQRLMIRFMKILESVPEDGEVNNDVVHYCERFLELIIDLEALLPTRRFFNTVLDDCHLVVRCHLASLTQRLEGNLFSQLESE